MSCDAFHARGMRVFTLRPCLAKRLALSGVKPQCFTVRGVGSPGVSGERAGESAGVLVFDDFLCLFGREGVVGLGDVSRLAR